MRFVYTVAHSTPDATAGADPSASSGMALPQAQMEVQPVSDPNVLHKKKGPASIAPSESSLSKDAAMTRMVDDLTGEDDSLDPLVEDEENLPPTPPTNNLEVNAMINDSTYGLSSLRTGDLVNATQGCTQEVYNITSSPSLRQLAALPSLPDQSRIWRQDAIPSAPSSPYLPQGQSLGARP